MTDLEQLRYPVGRFERVNGPLDRAARAALVDIIEQTPALFRTLTTGRTDAQLDTPYRPGGWTVRQVVHHVPDSHMNAYIRMKFAVDRRRAGDQGVRRNEMGGVAGGEDRSCRHVGHAARRAASAVGDVPPRVDRR